MPDVEIDNFKSRYRIPAGSKSPGAVKERLDHIARNLLENRCESALAYSSDDDGRLVFIKEMKLALSVNTARHDDESLAGLWSEGIAEALRATLRGRADGKNVVIFPNRAEYLAAFIADLLRGLASRRWYYRGFATLERLGKRGMVVELLAREGEIVEEVLLLLAGSGSLGGLLGLLEEDDVRVIYDGNLSVRGRGGSMGYRELAGLLGEIIDGDAPFIHGEGYTSYKNSLALYLKALQRHPGLSKAGPLGEALRLSVLLRAFFRKHGGRGSLGGAVRELRLKGLGPLIRAGSVGELSGLRPLVDKVIALEGEEAFLEIAKVVKEKTEETGPEKLFTRYGGLFFFARTLVESRLYRVIATSVYPEVANLDGTKALLLFLGEKITGQSELRCEGIDPGIRLFAGFKGIPMPQLLKGYLRGITPAMNAGFIESLSKGFPEEMGEIGRVPPDGVAGFEYALTVAAGLAQKLFASRLRGFKASSPEYLIKNIIERPSEVTPEEETVRIKMSRKPLDIVLRLSGFLEDIERVPWLDDRDIIFSYEGL